MKLAITATQPALDAEVDPRFGRARCFAIFDTETRAASFLDNSAALGSPHGAGIQAGQTVARTGARVLLTGRCGPKAFAVLQAAGVEICLEVAGTVAEAIAAWEEGRLAAAQDANSQGH